MSKSKKKIVTYGRIGPPWICNDCGKDMKQSDLPDKNCTWTTDDRFLCRQCFFDDVLIDDRIKFPQPEAHPIKLRLKRSDGGVGAITEEDE